MTLEDEIANKLAQIPKGYVGITDPDNYQRRLKYARAQAKSLMPLLKVYVVVGVYQGVISSVAVRSEKSDAERLRVDFDKAYNIERDDDGCHDSENDVSVFECKVDSAWDGDVII